MNTNPLTILHGGVDFSAGKRDGTTQPVKISQLPIRQLAAYAEKQADEAALVELFTGQPEGWDDTLTPEAHAEILRIGEELNADPFSQWIERQTAVVARVQNQTASLLGRLPVGSVLQPVTPPPRSTTSPQPASSGSTATVRPETPN